MTVPIIKFTITDLYTTVDNHTGLKPDNRGIIYILRKIERNLSHKYKRNDSK